ncbi:hypothetical protein AQUCO_04700096v1 [Aquilegia coerulea]|uniref:Uncharacterized protein n=1 Tax=Aquilegia coerulea TaxID=218851 RepID=A0A2G5CL29_AQUCA|nr:hypothetical protein AQUCO_04700096v1 [Aquilegia coerulea]
MKFLRKCKSHSILTIIIRNFIFRTSHKIQVGLWFTTNHRQHKNSFAIHNLPIPNSFCFFPIYTILQHDLIDHPVDGLDKLAKRCQNCGHPLLNSLRNIINLKKRQDLVIFIASLTI